MTTRLYLPAPQVYEGDDQCPACRGRGITGEQFRMQPGDDGRALVVDALCPTCGGCGRDGRHLMCTPMQHADWEPGDYDRDGEPTTDGSECPSCDGRQWNTVTSWTEGAGPDREQLIYQLRVPCGCAQAQLIELPEPSEVTH